MNSSVHTMEETLVAALIQLIVIILAARLAGAGAAALRQPRVVGEVIAGLLLGPSFLGHFFPQVSALVFNPVAATPITILSQIGLILLMFQIGSEFEFGQLRTERNKRAVVSIAIASVAVPLACGFALGQVTAPILAGNIDALTYSLFVAIALAITAVPVLGRILREYDMNKSDVGVIAISAAAANDVVGWVLLAGVSAFASAQFSLGQSGLQLAGLAALFLAFWFVGRPATDWLVRRFPIKDDALPTALMAIVIGLIFLAGIATQKLGIFTIFGGFLVGLLFHRHHAFVEAWRTQVGQFVLIFFLPVFFTYTGLRTNILGIEGLSNWLWCGAFIAVAMAAKIVPVFFAARLAGVSGAQASILGVLMNTRGLMELIVLNVGLSLGFLPQNVFSMLVLMAVVTTVMTGPLLQVLLHRAGAPAKRMVEA
jgi:Kef-type K+ transport system membrane component KefB